MTRAHRDGGGHAQARCVLHALGLTPAVGLGDADGGGGAHADIDLKITPIIWTVRP